MFLTILGPIPNDSCPLNATNFDKVDSENIAVFQVEIRFEAREFYISIPICSAPELSLPISELNLNNVERRRRQRSASKLISQSPHSLRCLILKMAVVNYPISFRSSKESSEQRLSEGRQSPY